MHRLLRPSYVLNTLRIKLKALRLRKKLGKYPYEHFASNVTYGKAVAYNIQYQDIYHSFSYFDFEKATKYYKGKSSVIHDTMLGIIEYNDMIRGHNVDKERLHANAQKLSRKVTYVDGFMTFVIDEDIAKFDLQGKVMSGIVQGKAASLFIRTYVGTGEKNYLNKAKSALLACLRTRSKGGVMISSSSVKSWVEEYDTDKPSMVFNGNVFVLIAAAEFLSFEEDYDIRKYLDDGLATLLAWLPHYFVGDDMLYSMYTTDLCNVHYVGVIRYQLEHLYQITGLGELKAAIAQLEKNFKPKLYESLF